MKHPIQNNLVGTLVTDGGAQEQIIEKQTENLGQHTREHRENEKLQGFLLPDAANTTRAQAPASPKGVTPTKSGYLKILQPDLRWISRFLFLVFQR